MDQSPAYGYLKHLTPEEVLAHIDWVILRGYLALEYDGRLPLLVYTKMGWALERETFTDELLAKLGQAAASQKMIDMSRLKDRNREMILLLLDKLEASGDSRFIPLLLAWEQIDYKKVRQRIRGVIERLSGDKSDS